MGSVVLKVLKASPIVSGGAVTVQWRRWTGGGNGRVGSIDVASYETEYCH